MVEVVEMERRHHLWQRGPGVLHHMERRGQCKAVEDTSNDEPIGIDRKPFASPRPARELHSESIA